MSRSIYCAACGPKRIGPIHPEDKAMGFTKRAVVGFAKRPAVHQIQTITATQRTVEDLPTLMCDQCGESIPDGEKCFAVTVAREELGPWEKEYLTAVKPEGAP